MATTTTSPSPRPLSSCASTDGTGASPTVSGRAVVGIVNCFVSIEGGSTEDCGRVSNLIWAAGKQTSKRQRGARESPSSGDRDTAGH